MMEIPEHRNTARGPKNPTQHPGSFAERRSEDFLQELSRESAHASHYCSTALPCVSALPFMGGVRRDSVGGRSRWSGSRLWPFLDCAAIGLDGADCCLGPSGHCRNSP